MTKDGDGRGAERVDEDDDDDDVKSVSQSVIQSVKRSGVGQEGCVRRETAWRGDWPAG
jgi:hypothetical protein